MGKLKNYVAEHKPQVIGVLAAVGLMLVVSVICMAAPEPAPAAPPAPPDADPDDGPHPDARPAGHGHPPRPPAVHPVPLRSFRLRVRRLLRGRVLSRGTGGHRGPLPHRRGRTRHSRRSPRLRSPAPRGLRHRRLPREARLLQAPRPRHLAAPPGRHRRVPRCAELSAV